MSFFLAVGYALFVLLMTLLWYNMELIWRTIPFFIFSATGIWRVEEWLLEFSFKVPGVLYKGIYRIIFYFIFPYGIMATIPTQLITGSITAGGLLVSGLTVMAFTVFALWFWMVGLRHYKSASS